MSNTPKYNKLYWTMNRTRLLREKRDRYLKDKKYRHEALIRSRGRTILRRIERKATPPTILHGGRLEKQYCIAQVAKTCKRTVNYFAYWRRRGAIPPATHQRGRYDCYSESQVKYLIEIFQILDQKKITSPLVVRALLNSVWNSLYKSNNLVRGKSDGGKKEGSGSSVNNVVHPRKRKDRTAERQGSEVRG